MKKLDIKKLQNNIEYTLSQDIEDCTISGASVSIYNNGATVFEGCYGMADTDSKEPLTINNIFRMASMSKPITAVCIMLEMERGHLDINDNLSKFIPGFKSKYVGKVEGGKLIRSHPASSEVKLLHLLTHTSGLLSADEIGSMQPVPQEDNVTLEKCINYYASNILLSDSPFERALYSGIAGFDTLSRVVEISSGMSFDEYVKKNVCDVLDMSDTTFTPTEEQWNRIVAMHDQKEGKNVTSPVGRHTFDGVPLTRFAGSCALVSTLHDYSHFAQMLLCEGCYNGYQLLKPETIRLMRTPHVPDTVLGIGPGETWGLGMRVVKKDAYLCAGTFGWSGAYGTHFFVDPVNDLCAVYLKNSRYDGGSGANTARAFEKDVMTALLP